MNIEFLRASKKKTSYIHFPRGNFGKTGVHLSTDK